MISAWQWGVIRASGAARAMDYRRGEGPPLAYPRSRRPDYEYLSEEAKRSDPGADWAGGLRDGSAQGRRPGSAVARLPGERRTGQGLAEEGSSGLEKGPSTNRCVNRRCLDGYADPGCPDTQAIRGGSADKILLGAAARYSGR
ncbi:hypothetical protein NDU88_007111 [Pleurodeles waltl]|uniref:Uncharacterized protein n=1 Tax=Pleurodeles waltl TaxID=8319 RepID=A0AAV7TYX9_PLEWA|nr:hypothetical protein NDU88_007111 [Pleurodeles waltl]